jgi:hypothetical protein
MDPRWRAAGHVRRPTIRRDHFTVDHGFIGGAGAVATAVPTVETGFVAFVHARLYREQSGGLKSVRG